MQPGIQQLLPVKTCVTVFYMLYLLVNDDRTDNQRDRDGKLGHDQPFPNKSGPGVQPDPLSFQHGHRMEGRQIEGGVAAGYQPAKGTDDQQAD